MCDSYTTKAKLANKHFAKARLLGIHETKYCLAVEKHCEGLEKLQHEKLLLAKTQFRFDILLKNKRMDGPSELLIYKLIVYVLMGSREPESSTSLRAVAIGELEEQETT